MFYSHTCFKTKGRAVAVTKGATKKHLCKRAAGLGAEIGEGGRKSKSTLETGARKASGLQALLLDFRSQR